MTGCEGASRARGLPSCRRIDSATPVDGGLAEERPSRGAELSPKLTADPDSIPRRVGELLEAVCSGLLAGGAVAFLGELLFDLAGSGELLFDLGDTLALGGELELEAGDAGALLLGGGLEAGRFDLGECELAGELLEPSGLLADNEGEGRADLIDPSFGLGLGRLLRLCGGLADVDTAGNRVADEGARADSPADGAFIDAKGDGGMVGADPYAGVELGEGDRAVEVGIPGGIVAERRGLSNF